ncbi:MAG TPA: PKD domain-containing protein, partial [Puia sp.]|nr:PKD domain-containing protein [Puia sp.]
LMQAEAQPDWKTSDGTWVPNWNSPSYQSRWAALNQAVANHIATTSYNGKAYKDAIYYIDVRGYGDFGEWHTYPWSGTEPAGRAATDASLQGIVESVKAAFPNYPLMIPMAAFDTDPGHSGYKTAAFAYYVLTTSNSWGPLGWRRDNYGDPEYNDWLSGDPGSYNGVSLSSMVMNKWKTSPIGGEPYNSLSAVTTCGSIYCDLINEINTFHTSSFGNGNYPVYANDKTYGSALKSAIIAASKACGYRLVLTGGSMTTNLSSGGAFNITLNWQNVGNAPVYEKWNVVYELRDGSGKVVWTGNSAFAPKLFLPGSASPASDNFTLGSVAAGTYSMYLIVRDPTAYKKPLPLAITGRNSDGSYLLRSNITVGAGNGNLAPTANAGADQTIQLPTAIATLTGKGTDADGTIASYSWAKVSGPATGGILSAATSATTNITGLIQGVYQYVLTVTDNQGATGTDTVQITVNAAAVVNQPPVAKAGSDITITLPTNSANLNGSSSSDPDGSITTYAWTKISGPSQYSLGNANAATTVLSNLVAGVYAFQLKVTDNSGATALDTIQVTVKAAAVVNQPPVANAGTDITLTLPANVTNLNGNASKDPDGSIASYAWTRISGPTQFTIANAGAATTRLSNLVQGVYAFQLKVTDNSGASALDTVLVTVNPAAVVNQPPIANAGAGFSITLPTSSATLNGSASKDPDGSIAAYAWTQSSGPSTAAIASPSSASTTVSGLKQGVYIFQLQVTDNSGATATDTVTVTVNAAANQSPVANAGTSKTITLPTNTVNLDGSLSADPDGSITGYSWTQVSGPSTAAFSGASTAKATASNLVAGVYTFQLTVTDNQGATAKAQVKITVNNAALPVANAGANQTITLPTNSVTIDGSGSSAPSGSIVSYAWTESSGPSTLALTNTVTNQLKNLVAGVYVISLTITDNSGNKASDSVVITVKPEPNRAPVADPGSNISLTLPNNSAKLDGSKSYDPDGTISSYSWTQISGPNTPAATGANTAVLNVSGLVAGQYTYQLKVTDNDGATAQAQVKITVVLPPNRAPYANAGPNQTITAPTSTVNLDGTDSYDPDGTIASYGWVKVSGPGSITIGNSNTATPTVYGLQTGSYVFELTVTDNRGAKATDQVTVTVNPQPAQPNQLPVANAGNDITITQPASSLALNGSRSFDPDGTISSYAWRQVSGPTTAGITAGSTATPTVTGLVVGQYVFELTVTDNNGATAKDQTTVMVNPEVPKANQAPLANAGTDTTITLPVVSYTLDASNSSDPDGTIASYQWLQLSGPNTASSSDMDAAKVNIGDLEAGVYEFQVTVTDNTGVSSTASVKVTVETDSSLVVDNLVVYPNPAHSYVTAKINNPITGTVQISIYDMNGQLVLRSQAEKTGDELTQVFNVSPFASGMYVIHIAIAHRKFMVGKFIKN